MKRSTLSMLMITTNPKISIAQANTGNDKSVLTLAAGLAAVRFIPSWPEMGTRYDAPTGAPRTDASAATSDGPAGAGPDPAEKSNRDLWKSLDEGSDPTED